MQSLKGTTAIYEKRVEFAGEYSNFMRALCQSERAPKFYATASEKQRLTHGVQNRVFEKSET